MWTIVFWAEVILAVGCFFFAKWWIKNKTTPNGEVYFWKDTVMIWGEDSSDTIEKMTALAKEIFSKGELLKSEEGFSVRTSMKNNIVNEVVVTTNKTKVTYTGKDLNVISTSSTKTEVIVFFTLMTWGTISLICWVIPWLITVIMIFVEIFSQIL